MKEVFGAMPRSRVGLETGMHSPWVSRLLSELGHEVIVAHARNVGLIGESRRKDDRLDAQTLVRLARIDPQSVALNEGLRCKKRLWRDSGGEQLEWFLLAPWGQPTTTRSPGTAGPTKPNHCRVDASH
jgi:hypothetical protein